MELQCFSALKEEAVGSKREKKGGHRKGRKVIKRVGAIKKKGVMRRWTDKR